MAGALLGPLVGHGPEGVRPFELHDLVEQDGDSLGDAVEAVLGQEFHDLVQGGSLHLVGRRRYSSLKRFVYLPGNRRWPAASSPAPDRAGGGFTEKILHY